MEQAKNQTGKRGRKALWAAVAVIAIAAAGLTGYKFTLENMITSQLEKRGGKAVSVSADFMGRIHLRDVTLPIKEGKDVHIASVDGRPKFLFLTGMLDASGISTEIANYRISIPRVTIDNADFDIATLRDTFGNSKLTLPERVGHFSAGSVAAQEIDVTQTIAGKEHKVVYKDIRLEDIKQGHIARYSAAGTEFDLAFDKPDEDGEMKSDRLTGTAGVTEGKDIDGVFLARLYTEKAKPDDNDFKPVYGPLSVKNIAFKSSEADISYEEIRSSGFTMRLPEEPFGEIVEKLAAVENPDDLPPAEQRAFFLRLMSLFDTIGKGDMEVVGLKAQSRVQDESGSGGLERMTMAFDNQKLDMAVKGLSFGKDKDFMKLDEFAIKGFSWASTSEALKKLAALSDEEAENFPYTTLLPEFGIVRMAGLSADLPYEPDAAAVDDETDNADEGTVEEKAASAMPERIQFSLKHYEIALTKPVNGIPTDIRVAYDDLSIPVPAQGNDEAYQQLRKLGYDRVTFSTNLEANWDEANQDLVIKDISMTGKDMGSVSLSGVLGGFTKQFFSGDKVMMQVAALGLKAREAKLRIEEKGLITKGLKLYAEENGMTEEEVRSSVALVAAAALQDLAAEQPKLQEAIAAFSAFLAKPNVFELTVKSKSPQGLGALDMALASQNPLMLLEKVDIEAKAE